MNTRQHGCRLAPVARALTTRLAAAATATVLLSACAPAQSSAPTAPRDRDAWAQTMEADALEHFDSSNWSEICDRGVGWACEVTDVSAALRGALVLRIDHADQPFPELPASQAVHEVMAALQPQHPSLQWVIATDQDHIVLARQPRTDRPEK